jgi:hypothetical protein
VPNPSAGLSAAVVGSADRVFLTLSIWLMEKDSLPASSPVVGTHFDGFIPDIHALSNTSEVDSCGR